MSQFEGMTQRIGADDDERIVWFTRVWRQADKQGGQAQ